MPNKIHTIKIDIYENSHLFGDDVPDTAFECMVEDIEEVVMNYVDDYMISDWSESWARKTSAATRNSGTTR